MLFGVFGEQHLHRGLPRAGVAVRSVGRRRRGGDKIDAAVTF
jgi:hypothetical protein